ncbi:signal peptidase I [Kitasatospora camelliae]|uniref:Signal peptidase I n=1 Tax=Kitasatospora camelliae TaxID=3156397 RepID=A0AAU8JYS8_9ACTN
MVQGVVIALGFVLLIAGFVLVAVDYRPYRIPTNSMSPTIEVGDTVLARKADGGSIGRGDVVVFKDETWGTGEMVKRVVAVGGDTVACCDEQGRLTVNGTPVDEPYIDRKVGQSAAFNTTVPTGRLFLLGDFRLNSLDSRSHLELAGGTVPESGVVARVEATVLPIGRAGVHDRVTAFDAVGGRTAHGPGLLEPAVQASVSGAALIVLASAAGWLVSLVRLVRRRFA